MCCRRCFDGEEHGMQCHPCTIWPAKFTVIHCQSCCSFSVRCMARILLVKNGASSKSTTSRHGNFVVISTVLPILPKYISKPSKLTNLKKFPKRYPEKDSCPVGEKYSCICVRVHSSAYYKYYNCASGCPRDVRPTTGSTQM